MSSKLLYGPYSPPAGVKRGSWLTCEYRGLVQVGGWSGGPIPWPKKMKSGRPSLILYGDLVSAVKKESEIAVAYWWGVSVNTVWQWRKLLGVDRMTAGTTELFKLNAAENLTAEVSEKGRMSSLLPENIEKRVEARRGRPMHKNTREALKKAVSKPKSQEWKEKARQRGKTQPHQNKYNWDSYVFLLGKDTDKNIAKLIGCSIGRVRDKRYELNIKAFRAKSI